MMPITPSITGVTETILLTVDQHIVQSSFKVDSML
jgi:hypothetical protein